ncbi:uncharacterized protein LOC126249285 [Schistocerca nitens]|uniref:uncharacterized protein LOC126249285 n=1 Tax=Schistocerca nitens TaxID=7011 RepID=UPI00211953D7|nr:uncharacterized protein LOC126249285 [Schistocerca nitens]
MGKKIAKNNFNFPASKCLPNSDIFMEHFIPGDEAFALSNYLMKPYSRRVARLDRDKEIFSYRLCRALRVAEYVFGLLSQIFRVFYTTAAVLPESVDDLIITACCLHNIPRDACLEGQPTPFY